MAICEQCGKEHDGTFGSGRFCSRSCSNKWVALHQSPEAKARKVEKGQGNLTHTWVGRKGPALGISTDSEKFVENFLDFRGIPYVREKRVSLRSLGLDKSGNYSLDFYFPCMNLDLEIDGTTHLKEERVLRDKERDEALQSSGFIVRRIFFDDDYDDLEIKLSLILEECTIL